MTDKTNLIKKTIEYFKQRGLIRIDDVALVGAINLKPNAIFYKPNNYAWYVMTANENEIRFYNINSITYEYQGEFTAIPINTIVKAKTKRTSVFLAINTLRLNIQRKRFFLVH
jgi:hypothetical protein